MCIKYTYDNEVICEKYYNNTVAMAISLWNKKKQQLDSEFHVWRAKSWQGLQ